MRRKTPRRPTAYKVPRIRVHTEVAKKPGHGSTAGLGCTGRGQGYAQAVVLWGFDNDRDRGRAGRPVAGSGCRLPAPGRVAVAQPLPRRVQAGISTFRQVMTARPCPRGLVDALGPPGLGLGGRRRKTRFPLEARVVVLGMASLAERLVPDELWELFRRVVPETVVIRPQGGGRRRSGDRECLAAIVFVATSGCTWRQVPPVSGPAWPTVYRRFAHWSADRVWARLHR